MKNKFRILFYSLFLLISAAIIFLAIYIVIDNNNKETLIYIFSFAFLLIILSILVYLYVLEERKSLLRLAYYAKNNQLANDIYFRIKAKKLFKKNKAKAYIVSFCVDDFDELELSTLTNEELHDLIEVLSSYLKKKYNVKGENSFVSYDLKGVFLIYLERESEYEVLHQIDNLIDDLRIEFSSKGYGHNVRFFAGLAEVNDENIEIYLNNAQVARYNNAKSSKVNVLAFNEQMKKENREAISMKDDIIRALENEEFEIYYQPKFNIKLNRFTGAEALIRWNHPEKGLVPPGAFIPFAEQNGLVVDIDRYVFERVCKDIASWKENKTRLMLISINLSRNDVFKDDIIEFYSSTIDKYHISPLLIELEITESAVTKDMLYTCSILNKLKALRFKTSMDDFGIGYSSLSYLKRMPVDILKLDKSFFDEIEIDKCSRDIVSTTIKLAKALDMHVVAEGIQTEKQLQFLKSTECDVVQGYYYSKPLRKTEYESFLRNNKFEGGR